MSDGVISPVSASSARSESLNRRLGRAALYLVVSGLSIIFMGPFFWTITSSLKSIAELHVYPPLVFPAVAEWHNYVQVWLDVPFGIWVLNSVVIAFIAHWEEFMQPLIYLHSESKFTLAIGLPYFQDQAGYLGTVPRDNLLMAAAIMSTLPSITLFFLAQRYFVEGVVMTGIKG